MDSESFRDESPAPPDAGGENKRGRRPGRGKVPGSGRKAGTKNKISRDVKETIMLRGKPLELLCDIARGVKIRVGAQAGPGAEYVYPSLKDRREAAAILLSKIAPDLKSIEATTTNETTIRDQSTNRQLARAILWAAGERAPTEAVAKVIDEAKADLGDDGWSPHPSDLGIYVGETEANAMADRYLKSLGAAPDISPAYVDEVRPSERKVGERVVLAEGRAFARYTEQLPDGRAKWWLERSNGDRLSVHFSFEEASAKADDLAQKGKL